MKTLIVVDCQFDFCDPLGSLYVPGSEKSVENIVNLVKSDEIDKIIFTLNWHTTSDGSFLVNGGTWPNHCINYNPGSSIVKKLCDLDFQGEIEYFLKGQDPEHEEYGAFELQMELPGSRYYISNWLEECEIRLDSDHGLGDVILCGVAGDYCVLETLKNLLNIPKDYIDSINVYLPGISSIDGGKKLRSFIEEYKSKVNIYGATE